MLHCEMNYILHHKTVLHVQMYQLLNIINIAIGVEVTILDLRDITITSLMTTRTIYTRRGAVLIIVDARI